MSHAAKLLLLSCLTCAFACSVPSIDALEEQRRTECNAEHPCPEGTVCFEDHCIRTEGLACVPGTSEACGSNVGVCRQGTHQCGADGTFGVCEGEVPPSAELCGDNLDNDCDGLTDTWSPTLLTPHHDAGSTLAAIPVARSSVGKADTTLIVTLEAGSLVARTYTNGTLSPGVTIASPPPGSSYRSPTLVADGDTVALAWLEQPPSPSTGVAPNKVHLALLDGDGNVLRPDKEILYGGTNPLVTGLTLALNPTDVLVLVSTSTAAPVGTTPSRELRAVTVARDYSATSASFSISVPLDDAYAPHATAGSTADQFLVAYEDGSDARTGVIVNAGRLASSTAFTKAANTHSPFIVPGKSSAFYTLYFVSNDSLGRSSLMSVLCNSGLGGNPSVGCSSTLTTVTSYAHRINRMQMAARPGVATPDLALWTWRDDGMASNALSVYSLSSGTVSVLQPSTSATFGEVLVQMPDSTHFLLYHQSPPPAVAGSTESQAYLWRFCGP